MSPDQDEHQLHPSAVRLSSIDIEMPAVSRGWSPIAQSDDHLPNSTNGSTSSTSNSTPKNHNGHAATSATSATSPNHHHNGSTHLTPPGPPNATIIPNGSQNGSTTTGAAYQNGHSNGLNGSVAKTGANGTPVTMLPLNGNGTAKTANNNDLWSPTSTASAASGVTLPATLPSALASAAATTNNSSPSRVEKNGWKELPQDEPGTNGTANGLPSNGNGNGATAAGAADGRHNAEDDPLTGVICKDIDPDELSTCGIGACQPKWARMFASTKSFMCVFLIAWVLQGMYFTYVVSVITTIEKLFQIKSKTSGMLLSTTEVGQISTALLLTYYAGQGHRPRWIACGMVLFAVCALGCSIPHFMYGDELLRANNALYTQRSVSTNGVPAVSAALRAQTTTATSAADELADRVLPMLDAANRTYGGDSSGSLEYNLCRADGDGAAGFEGACQTDQLEEQETHTQITYTVLLMLVICMLGVGVGQTAVATLGIPFIDDNVASRESAIYIAITIGVRILGPTSGFMLGSVCTRLHVDLLDPGYGPEDPKWVGAWYLGLVIIPTLMFLAALAMFTFPRHLKGHRIPPPVKLRAIENAKKLEMQEAVVPARPRLRDFPKTIRRQLSNDILMFRTASSVLHLLPVAGLYTFLPKYLESQFQMAAHESSMITGTYGILVMGVGIVISGVVILKCSPTAKSVAAYIAFTAIVYSAGMAALMFFGCSMDDFIGMKTGAELTGPGQMSMSMAHGDVQFAPPCNVTCDCDFSTFAPICGSDGKTYFSSCHAGCTIASVVNGKTTYKDCECIPDIEGAKLAITGHCDSTCQSYIAFIALFSFLVFMHSTSEVGSMLLIMRCTDPKDKAMAMGIIQFAIGLFGNVPCPIIYGAVIDSTCLVWDTICGKQGACKQYDKDAFRHFFFGTTSGIMFLAFIMDLVVWHKAHRIDIDPEKNASSTSSASSAHDVETAAEKPMSSSSSSTAVVAAGATIVPDSSV